MWGRVDLEVALLDHAVSFIQHKEGEARHVCQVCVPVLHQLPQPPRGGHHYLQEAQLRLTSQHCTVQADGTSLEGALDSDHLYQLSSAKCC